MTQVGRRPKCAVCNHIESTVAFKLNAQQRRRATAVPAGSTGVPLPDVAKAIATWSGTVTCDLCLFSDLTSTHNAAARRMLQHVKAQTATIGPATTVHKLCCKFVMDDAGGLNCQCVRAEDANANADTDTQSAPRSSKRARLSAGVSPGVSPGVLFSPEPQGIQRDAALARDDECFLVGSNKKTCVAATTKAVLSKTSTLALAAKLILASAKLGDVLFAQERALGTGAAEAVLVKEHHAHSNCGSAYSEEANPTAVKSVHWRGSEANVSAATRHKDTVAKVANALRSYLDGGIFVLATVVLAVYIKAGGDATHRSVTKPSDMVQGVASRLGQEYSAGQWRSKWALHCNAKIMEMVLTQAQEQAAALASNLGVTDSAAAAATPPSRTVPGRSSSSSSAGKLVVDWEAQTMEKLRVSCREIHKMLAGRHKAGVMTETKPWGVSAMSSNRVAKVLSPELMELFELIATGGAPARPQVKQAGLSAAQIMLYGVGFGKRLEDVCPPPLVLTTTWLLKMLAGVQDLSDCFHSMMVADTAECARNMLYDLGTAASVGAEYGGVAVDAVAWIDFILRDNLDLIFKANLGASGAVNVTAQATVGPPAPTAAPSTADTPVDSASAATTTASANDDGDEDTETYDVALSAVAPAHHGKRHHGVRVVAGSKGAPRPGGVLLKDASNRVLETVPHNLWSKAIVWKSDPLATRWEPAVNEVASRGDCLFDCVRESMSAMGTMPPSVADLRQGFHEHLRKKQAEYSPFALGSTDAEYAAWADAQASSWGSQFTHAHVHRKFDMHVRTYIIGKDAFPKLNNSTLDNDDGETPCPSTTINVLFHLFDDPYVLPTAPLSECGARVSCRLFIRSHDVASPPLTPLATLHCFFGRCTASTERNHCDWLRFKKQPVSGMALIVPGVPGADKPKPSQRKRPANVVPVAPAPPRGFVTSSANPDHPHDPSVSPHPSFTDPSAKAETAKCVESLASDHRAHALHCHLSVVGRLGEAGDFDSSSSAFAKSWKRVGVVPSSYSVVKTLVPNLGCATDKMATSQSFMMYVNALDRKGQKNCRVACDGGDYWHCCRILWSHYRSVNGEPLSRRLMLEPGGLHLYFVCQMIKGLMTQHAGIREWLAAAGVCSSATAKQVLRGKQCHRAENIWSAVHVVLMGELWELHAAVAVADSNAAVSALAFNGPFDVAEGLLQKSKAGGAVVAKHVNGFSAWLIKLREKNKFVDFWCLVLDVHELEGMLRLNMRKPDKKQGGIQTRVALTKRLLPFLFRLDRHLHCRIFSVWVHQVEQSHVLQQDVWRTHAAGKTGVVRQGASVMVEGDDVMESDVVKAGKNTIAKLCGRGATDENRLFLALAATNEVEAVRKQGMADFGRRKKQGQNSGTYTDPRFKATVVKLRDRKSVV